MLFSVLVSLMVVLIAAFWTYQGFFSALIMFFEAVIACMIAFGFYENVASLVSESMGLGLALAVAFMALFIGSLALLRMATDKLIRESVSLPVPLDRGGAAIAGLFAGQIIVGCTMTAIQMMPIGSGVMSFERMETDLTNGETKVKSLGPVFRPDEFVCGLASLLSNGRFGSEDRSLADQKPDLIMSLYSARSFPMSEENMFVNEGDVVVEKVWWASKIDKVTHTLDGTTLSRAFAEDAPSKPANSFLVCKVKIAKNASGKDKGGEIRFRPSNFRIVGPPPGSSAQPRVFLAAGMTDIYTHRTNGPKAVQQAQRDRLVAFSPTTDFVLGPNETKVLEKGDHYVFDVAFEVPAEFQPWYLEFKHGGRADVAEFLRKKKLAQIPKDIPDDGSRSQGTGGLSGTVRESGAGIVGAAPGGTGHNFNAIDDRTAASDDLPITLNRNKPGVSNHLVQGKVGGDNCQFWLELDDDPMADGDEVTKFAVPGDKRMVQIGANIIKQETYLGRALGFANRVVGQTKIHDDNGNEYYAIGFYLAVEENGKTTFEMQYDPTSEVPERALKKPTKFTHSRLSSLPPEKIKFGFLFVVTPGVRIVKFSANNTTSQDMVTPIEVPN